MLYEINIKNLQLIFSNLLFEFLDREDWKKGVIFHFWDMKNFVDCKDSKRF